MPLDSMPMKLICAGVLLLALASVLAGVFDRESAATSIGRYLLAKVLPTAVMFDGLGLILYGLFRLLTADS